jgi:SWIM zinc finger
MLTTESVLALAPDDGSAKAARGLVAPGKWPLLGADDKAVWGECQGSGSKPYQTQVDLAGPAFRCTCPSRKFPCKHGLALLVLRVQNAAAFAAQAQPAWVSEWLASRADKAHKKEVRATQAVAPPDPAEAAAQQARSAKNEAQRWQRIEAAAQDLQRWLADQISAGLSALNDEALAGWHTIAARMVDAQAPGLGQRVREAAGGVRQGHDWPERTLQRLGLLQLACEAIARRGTLSSEMLADLRTLAGWPYDRADVLALAPQPVADRWTVLGVATEERADKLIERRVWLHGAGSGRRAWLLDHAHGGRGFDAAWLPGSSADAELFFFPGASALRAFCVLPAAQAVAPVWPHATLQEEWDRIAERSAASPWLRWHPLVLCDAVLLRQGTQWLALAQDRALVLALPDTQAWLLLACSGGAPLHMAGEWDGRALAPLAAWSANEPALLWQRNAL